MRALTVALILAAVPLSSMAQEFPSKPVHIVVPYGGGGTPDVIARILTEKMSATFGQPFIVDNKPGANGIIAAEQVAKSKPDGYTLFLADTGQMAINPALQSKLPYDPIRDFSAIAQLVYSPFFIFAQTTLGVATVQELVQLARKRPGLIYGSVGNGSPHHLCMALLGKNAGVELVHVPYKLLAQAVPALMSGEISLLCTSPLSGLPVVKAGKARLLAAASSKRSGIMPDVPTVLEAGIPDVEAGPTIGLLAPAGTPRGVIQRLSEEALLVINGPDAKEKLHSLGQDVTPAGPAEYGALIQQELAKYSRLVKISGAVVD